MVFGIFPGPEVIYIIDKERHTLVEPRSRLVFAGALALTCLGLACSSAPTSAKAAVKSENERKVAPDFALKDSNGATVKLSDYKGKVVLLDFWATWCGPCKIEIPWFIEFEQTYKDKGFAVLGVSMDEDGWTAVKPYLLEHKLNYRVALGNEQVGQMYGGLDALPTTFMIDRAGKIAKVHIGLETGKDGFQNEINSLLAAPRASRVPASNFLPAWFVSPR